jgi:hypothetical protein
MAVSKNITRESMALATAIAGGLADGHTCLLTDQNNQQLHRIGSNYYLPAQSKYYNGSSWTYYTAGFAAVEVPSTGYFGLAAGKGRFVFTDDAQDYITVKTADLHIPDGWLKIGADTQPASALDVVGDASFTGGLTVAGTIEASSGLNIIGGLTTVGNNTEGIANHSGAGATTGNVDVGLAAWGGAYLLAVTFQVWWTGGVTGYTKSVKCTYIATAIETGTPVLTQIGTDATVDTGVSGVVVTTAAATTGNIIRFVCSCTDGAGTADRVSVNINTVEFLNTYRQWANPYTKHNA